MKLTLQPDLTRRNLLKQSTLAAAAALGGVFGRTVNAADAAQSPGLKGRINHSVVDWCFTKCGDKWSLEKLCQVSKELGITSIELGPVSNYPVLKKYGLKCAIANIDISPDLGFQKGFNNPVHWPRVIKATKDAIEAAADFGCPNVIAFTGYAAEEPGNPGSRVLSLEEGSRNCVEGLKQVMAFAEQKKVTLCLELLNTRDSTHPMKGHPGYQGDHMDYCMDIIRKVGSERCKLLFDVYHVQVQDGDLIRHIRENKEFIAHVHTAGNPGRCELDHKQEINYGAVMEALMEMGYQGYVGHEFIPTRDAYSGLKAAVEWCDV